MLLALSEGLGLFSEIVYDGLEEALATSSRVVLLSKAEPWACFEVLLEDDDEEWREAVDVFGRRLRLASAVVVLSRAIAAIDNRLFLACVAVGADVASL